MPRVVLWQPEIPQNTGNIGRLCVATNTPLYLIEPMGFVIDDKRIRRSGLDYWPHLNLNIRPSFASLREEFPQARFWFLTTRTKTPYTSVQFQSDDFLVFGSESLGLPDNFWKNSEDRKRVLTIPMSGPTRSLNLASSVAIVLYESLRQLGES